jgi:hypothetical protein
MDSGELHYLINISLPCISLSEANRVMSRLAESDLESLFRPLSYRQASRLNVVTSGTNSGTFTDPPLIQNFYPNKAYSKQEVFITVELKYITEGLLENMQVMAQIDGLPLNILIYSSEIFSDGTVLMSLKIRLTDLVGKVQIVLWAFENNMSPISFYFESLSVETEIGNFEPKSGFIFGGTIVNIQINNLPRNVSCSNLIFYFPYPSQLEADCIFFQYFVSSASAQVSIRLPPASDIGAVIPTMLLLPDKNRQYPFPQKFAYLDPPNMLVDLVSPSVAFIGTPRKLWIRVLNFPLINSSSDVIMLLKPKSDNPIPIDIQGPVISSPSAISAFVQDVQFNVLTPNSSILNKAGIVDLEIYHRSFSNLKVLSRISFVDQALPQVNRLTLLETGLFSLNGLPLQVGSDSEKRISISLSNIPFSTAESNWSVHGQFVRGLDYTFSSKSSGTGTAVVKVHNFGGSQTLQYGLLSFGPLARPFCNSSCCSDSTCDQATKCGKEISVVCFSLVFFDDRAVDIININPSTG